MHNATIGILVAVTSLFAAYSYAQTEEAAVTDPAPVLRVETDSGHAMIPFLSWDTEGGARSRTNLLRDPVHLRLWSNGQWLEGRDLPTRLKSADGAAQEYKIAVSAETEVTWTVTPGSAGRLAMQIGTHGQGVEKAEVVFPFNPRSASTCVLPSGWDEDGRLRLPSIISAPDLG